MLAPFLHSKCGAIPPLRYIGRPITLPRQHPTSPKRLTPISPTGWFPKEHAPHHTPAKGKATAIRMLQR
jgi:hypothetical protein